MEGKRNILKLGTRGSMLARTQSEMVRNWLTPFFNGRIELELITTSGDKRSAGALGAPGANENSEGGGNKAEFVKEIEEALQEKRIDFAVHSAKDLPLELPTGLVIAATPKRELPNDVWIGYRGIKLAELPEGARVGTSSLRRQAQLLMQRPDLEIVPLRGNIDTRLKRVAAGIDSSGKPLLGTFLAAAGLRRANMMPPEAEVLATESFIPAAGQGTLVLECRGEDQLVVDLLRKLHDEHTGAALACERKIVRSLSGSCLAPIGACAELRLASAEGAGGGWIVRAIVAAVDGKDFARAVQITEDGSVVGLVGLGSKILEILESRGARKLLPK